MSSNPTISATTKKVDHLTEDIPIPRQNYVCLSFLSPEGIKNCTVRGLKVRGIYDTKEEAKERCEELQGVDPNFHVFVGEVGKWLPWDPDPNSTKDQVYQEKELNDLMQGYNDNLKKAKKMQDQRKDDMMKDAAYDQQSSKKEETRERLQKKHAKMQMQKKMTSVAKNSMKSMLPEELTKDEKKLKSKQKKNDSQVKLGDKERERLFNNDKEIHNQKNNVKMIDDRLEKIKALYAKSKQKRLE
jgi:membrane-associated HD superfamily phosphohydrolase